MIFKYFTISLYILHVFWWVKFLQLGNNLLAGKFEDNVSKFKSQVVSEKQKAS